LSLRRREYVEAARAGGESTWRIIFFEILPNLTAVIASGFVGTVIFAVMSEITLAFIGVSGVSNWNWGTILFWAQSQQALAQGAWWWFVPAGLAIALLGTALSLLNYGLGDQAVHAVRDVNLTLHRGEVLGLAGESGSGKSTLAYGVTRLLPPPGVISAGEVVYHPPDGEPFDVMALTPAELRAFRWAE